MIRDFQFCKRSIHRNNIIGLVVLLDQLSVKVASHINADLMNGKRGRTTNTLSVSITAMTSSTLTGSPTFFSQTTRVPMTMEGSKPLYTFFDGFSHLRNRNDDILQKGREGVVLRTTKSNGTHSWEHDWVNENSKKEWKWRKINEGKREIRNIDWTT